MVELEAWTPVGCAQQGLHGTRQIDEHVAHEEEPGAEGPERLLTTHNGTVVSCRCSTTHRSPPFRETLPVCTMESPLWASTQQLRDPMNKSHAYCLWAYTTGAAIASTIMSACPQLAQQLSAHYTTTWTSVPTLYVSLVLTLYSDRKEKKPTPHTLHPGVFAGYSHGQDGGHTVQGGNEDTSLTDEGCEQQGPCGLPVGFSMAKHLQDGER